MPSLELKGIRNFVLKGVNLKVFDGELLVLLGPTGAGKTTLLNVVAGLTGYEGSVLLDGVPLEGVPTNRREVGYLFQDLALFPHLDVASNIAYGLKAQGVPPERVRERVKELLELMKVEHLAHRHPKDLSGGERQRVALARTIAPWPKVLLLDEPLGSLDLRTAKYLRMEIKRLQRSLRITTIYVTHNQTEAEELGDRIAVIDEGKVEQVGTPEEIFFSPKNERVSEFIGSPNILECEECRPLGNGLAEVRCGGIKILIPCDGEVRKVAISPREVYVSKDPPPGPEVNRFRGRIIEVIPGRSITRLKVEVGRRTFLTELPQQIWEELDLKEGDDAFLILKFRGLRVLAR